MHKCIYELLKELTKDDVQGVYLDFVQDNNINKNNNYIVYSLITRTPHYQFEYAKSIYQISVYSNNFDNAVNIQQKIGKYFSSLLIKKENIEIIGCEVSNETYNYIDDYYQTVSIIEILYKE